MKVSKYFKKKRLQKVIKTKVTRPEIEVLKAIDEYRYRHEYDERLKTPTEIAYEMVFNEGALLNKSGKYETGLEEVTRPEIEALQAIAEYRYRHGYDERLKTPPEI